MFFAKEKYSMAKTFSGGIHPPECKQQTENKPFIHFPLGDKLVCLMSQHIGIPAKPIVKKDEKVKRGQVIGEASGMVSCFIHAPTSGTVVAVEPVIHPLGRKMEAVIIQPDGEDIWMEDFSKCRAKAKKLSAQEMLKIIQDSGIAGMGGATFPSHVKLSPPKDKVIDTLIINGVECEPYLTCDHRLMLDFAEEIIQGAKIIQSILGVKQIHIGIEGNKPDAFEKIKQAASQKECEDIHVHLLKVKYPQGAEKQLIKAIINRDVPAGGLPMDIGVVVHNVMTTYYIYRAIYFNEPVTERYLTITGDGVENPQNLRVRIGTPISKILEYAKLRPGSKKIILGGPMMGMAQYSEEVPVTKGTSGILVLQDTQDMDYKNCIRCGACVDHCPMRLVPSELSITLQRGRVDLAEQYNLMDCMECGVCAYVCPANRPIVQFVKLGKAQLMKQRKAKGAK